MAVPVAHGVMLGAMAGLGAPELLIILVIILLVFGGAKLPKLARSLGQAQKEFRHGTTETEHDEPAGEGGAAKGEPRKDRPSA